MSSVVNYDSVEMASIKKAYADARVAFETIKSSMNQEVDRIRNNWHGDDADKAAPDLKAIDDQMDNIQQNISEINKIIIRVIDNFGELKY